MQLAVAIYLLIVLLIYSFEVRAPKSEHPPAGPLVAASVLPLLFALFLLAFLVLVPLERLFRFLAWYEAWKLGRKS